MNKSHPSYVTPESIDEVSNLLDEHGQDAKLMAGGQSLSLLLRQDLLDPVVIVDISQIDGLNDITTVGGEVRIGATTTYDDLESHPIAREYTCLGDAVDVIADQQIRNLGTVGGAVAHGDPSLDVLPPLVCLDARLHVVGKDSERRVPFPEFYQSYMMTDLADDELVAGIEFDAIDAPHGSAYEKFANVRGGWATVGVGSVITLADDGETIETARVALSAVDDTPVRAPSAEEILEDATASDNVAKRAAAEIDHDIEPLDDLAGAADYKADLAIRLGARNIRTAIDQAKGGETA